MKKIFDYCVKVNWNEKKVAKMASYLGLAYDEMIEKVLVYAKKNVDSDTYSQIVEKIEIQKSSDEFFELNTFNPILLDMFGVKTYRIWQNDEEKKIVLETIYQRWKKDNDIKSIIKDFGISKEDVFRLLKMYAISYLEMSEDEWDRKKLEFDIKEKHGNYTATSKLVGIYEALIKVKNIEDIINIINSSGYTTTYLKHHLHNYLVRYNSTHYDEYMSSIASKLKMYNTNKREQEKMELNKQKEAVMNEYVRKMLPYANKLVKMFVDSSYPTLKVFFDKVDYKTDSGLTVFEMFEKCLSIVKDYNIELYKEYELKLEKEKKKYYEEHIRELVTIISLIKNGLEENKIKRPFDIIDFFQFTTLSLSDMLSIAKEAYANKDISSKDYAFISRFFSNNKKGEMENEKDIAVIYNEIRKVNVIRNSKDGVSNTLETIQNETKDKLIDYLISNNVPVNYVTYNTALERYKMGYLLFEDFKSY